MQIIVAVGSGVRSVGNDGSQMKSIAAKNTKEVVAVDLDHERNIVFWADAYISKIFSAFLGLKNPTANTVAVASGSHLKDLAVDWIASKLYWLTTSSQGTVINTMYLSTCFSF